MTYLGLPVDIQIVGIGDNRLESGELVVFHEEAYNGRYGKDNVYFFSYGGPTGARMASRTVSPSGADPDVHHPHGPRRTEPRRIF